MDRARLLAADREQVLGVTCAGRPVDLVELGDLRIGPGQAAQWCS